MPHFPPPFFNPPELPSRLLQVHCYCFGERSERSERSERERSERERSEGDQRERSEREIREIREIGGLLESQVLNGRRHKTSYSELIDTWKQRKKKKKKSWISERKEEFSQPVLLPPSFTSLFQTFSERR